MFTQFHNPQSLHGELLDFYLANGWFRSGQYIYTTKILNFDGKLYSPIRIRLPLEGYEFRKSLRKIWNKNQQFSTVFRKAFISREKEELYQKHKLRFDGYVSQTIKDALQDGGETTIYDTYEVAVYDGEKLIAVSFFDLGNKSMASIIGLFDPDYSSYSLGFYTMLAEIKYGKKKGYKFYYPGYIIPNYPKFDYKLRIGEVDFYKAKEDKWLPFPEMNNNDLPSEVIENQLIKMGMVLKMHAIDYKIYFYPLFDKGYMNHIGELQELETPLFIQLQSPINNQKLVIDFDLQKHCYRLTQFHGFLKPIENFYDSSTHKEYDTFKTLLIRQFKFKESKKPEEIAKTIMEMMKLSS
jgi:arginine-tRNA-protein transferase